MTEIITHDEREQAAERRRAWQQWAKSDDEFANDPYSDRNRIILEDSSTLANAYLDLDNPGMLELILDTKKLCSCESWCEHCIGDTARRLVKACLTLRAKVAEIESHRTMLARLASGLESEAIRQADQLAERDARIQGLEAQVEGHCDRIAAQSALLSKKVERVFTEATDDNVLADRDWLLTLPDATDHPWGVWVRSANLAWHQKDGSLDFCGYCMWKGKQVTRGHIRRLIIALTPPDRWPDTGAERTP